MQLFSTFCTLLSTSLLPFPCSEACQLNQEVGRPSNQVKGRRLALSRVQDLVEADSEDIQVSFLPDIPAFAHSKSCEGLLSQVNVNRGSAANNQS